MQGFKAINDIKLIECRKFFKTVTLIGRKHVSVHIPVLWSHLCHATLVVSSVHPVLHWLVRLSFSDREVNSGTTCEICGHTFLAASSLRNHRAIHRGETKCYICHGVFAQKGNLKRHLKKAHNIDQWAEQVEREICVGYQRYYALSRCTGVDAAIISFPKARQRR